MKKQHPPQIIMNNGKPEWAVIPYKEYLHLVEIENSLNELTEFHIKVKQGEEELIPNEFAMRLIKGENPIRVWREYRHISQADLALEVGISIPYLSQIECNERTPSIDVAKRIAETLKVSVDDII